jgi:hypothetical protein
MTSTSKAVERSTRVYRWLLRSYPAAFRYSFGDEMELVFRELATDAWEQRGRRGLASVWVRVLIDFARTRPYQHYLARTAEVDMTSQQVKTVGLACVSIATAVALNFVSYAALAITVSALSLIPGNETFRSSPKMDPLFIFVCPALTGFIAGRIRPFYRPQLTAPLGSVLLAAGIYFLHPRMPWYGAFGWFCLVGTASAVGCFLSTRLRRRTAVVQAA